MERIKLLIVEDDPIIAADLTRATQKMGYEVMEAVESGEEALDAVAHYPPDLILMDIQLEGDLDGIDTAHIISKKSEIPIIFLTSNTDERTFNRAKLTQPHGFLSKPFRATDIKHSIDLAFLDRQPSAEAIQNQQPATLSHSVNNHIFVKSKEHLVKIQLDSICFIEADSCYCTIQTETESHVIVSTLKKFLASISHANLVRIHRSYAVNLHYIDKLGDSLAWIKGQEIPIGRSYKEHFFSKIQKL